MLRERLLEGARAMGVEMTGAQASRFERYHEMLAEANARRVVEHAALKLGEDAEIQVLIKAGLQELGR